MNRVNVAVGALAFAISAIVVSSNMAEASRRVPPAPPKFASVAGLMKTQCVSCHNAKNHPEQVDVSSFKALMGSGDHGPIVIAGHPEKSKLVLYIDGTKSPRMPMGKPALSKAQIQLVKDWVKAGAKGS